jgi:hypothetical protein
VQDVALRPKTTCTTDILRLPEPSSSPTPALHPPYYRHQALIPWPTMTMSPAMQHGQYAPYNNYFESCFEAATHPHTNNANTHTHTPRPTHTRPHSHTYAYIHKQYHGTNMSTLPWPYHVMYMAISWQSHGAVMSISCMSILWYGHDKPMTYYGKPPCMVFVMFLPCSSHVLAVLLLCSCHGSCHVLVMFLPCSCHVLAMLLPSCSCRDLAMCWPCSCCGLTLFLSCSCLAMLLSRVGSNYYVVVADNFPIITPCCAHQSYLPGDAEPCKAAAARHTM